jgi:hypothetical protein
MIACRMPVRSAIVRTQATLQETIMPRWLVLPLTFCAVAAFVVFTIRQADTGGKPPDNQNAA